MTPMDIKTREEWETIIGRFARDANITTCLTAAAGKPYFCCLDRNPLCEAIRENPDATTFICSQINTAMLAVVKRTLRPEVDVCDAGLFRIVVPVVYDGNLVGLVVACGLASTDEELDAFLVAKQLGITEERVRELAESTPHGSEEDLARLGGRLFEELHPGRR